MCTFILSLQIIVQQVNTDNPVLQELQNIKLQINNKSETFELIFSPTPFSIISATSINFILRKYSDYANPLTYSYYIYILMKQRVIRSKIT